MSFIEILLLLLLLLSVVFYFAINSIKNPHDDAV